MTDPLKALFFIEGSGSELMGLIPFVAAMQVGVKNRKDVTARFLLSPTVHVRTARFADHVDRLSDWDLDLQQSRWHTMLSLHTRRCVLSDLKREPADVVGCLTHAVGLMLARAVAPRPVVLMADSAIWEWRQMESYRRLRRWSRAVMAPSFALERRALRPAALVIAWSEWTRHGLLKRAPDANVEVIHPGLDLTMYRPAQVRAPRVRPRVCRCSSAGRLGAP
jgi:Glycosyltransferase Family 4